MDHLRLLPFGPQLAEEDLRGAAVAAVGRGRGSGPQHLAMRQDVAHLGWNS